MQNDAVTIDHFSAPGGAADLVYVCLPACPDNNFWMRKMLLKWSVRPRVRVFFCCSSARFNYATLEQSVAEFQNETNCTLVPLLFAGCRHWSSFSWYTVTRTMSSVGESACGRWPRPCRRRRHSLSVADVTTVLIQGDVGSGMFTRNSTVYSPPDSPQPLPGAAALRQTTGPRFTNRKPIM